MHALFQGVYAFLSREEIAVPRSRRDGADPVLVLFASLAWTCRVLLPISSFYVTDGLCMGP